MSSISGLRTGTTLQFFQSAASRGTGVRVTARVGSVGTGGASTVGWERVGTSVAGTAVVGAVKGLVEHAASKAVINKRKRNFNLILLFACGLNGFRDLAGQQAFSLG